MSRERLLRTLAALVCVIAVFHIAATLFYLYWKFWWYDMLLHFLGGIFIALLVLWIRFFSGYFGVPPIPLQHKALRFALLATLCIGVGWEVFERALGHTWSVEGYWLDTSIDIALDVAGGLVGFLFFKRRYLHHVG